MKAKLNKIKIIIAISLLILVSVISINYAHSFYRGKTKENNETETILKSKKIALVFDDTKEVNVLDMLPGKSLEKTFTVTSDADETLTYNIKFKDIVKTYKKDMVYTLKCNGEEIVKETPLPKTSIEEYILENIKINPGEKREYILTITYKNLENELQIVDKNDTFSGTVEIDLEKEKEPLIKTYEDSEEITNEEIKNNEVIKEFRVRNADVKKTINYSINLSNLTNTYEANELNYTLEKNGEKVKEAEVPKTGELTYIYYNQSLKSGETDNYKLIVNKESENEKEFKTKIEINTKEVKDTKPEAIIAVDSKTSKSITVNASCIDEESGIKKYSFYKNNELVKEIETKEKSYKYTYDNLNEKEYELKLVCTNNFDVISNSEIKETPNVLVIPTIEKNDNYEQEKKVIVKYPGEGNKYLLLTGTVTANKDLYKCTEEMKCTELIKAGTKLDTTSWHKTEEDLELTYKTNGTIKAKVNDTINEKETEEIEIINVDNEKPTVTFETNGNNTYAKSQGTKVTVTDNLSGVSTLKYQWTNSTNQPAVSTFTNTFASGDTLTKSDGTGDYYLWILAIDNAGNQIIIKSNTFKLDNNAPSCNWSGESTTYRTSADITVTCKDQESGCLNTTNSKTWNYKETKVTDEVSYTISDNAGNTTTCSKTINVYVDTTPPTCNIEGNITNYTNGNVTLKVVGTDEHSGGVTYSWDGTTYGSNQTKEITANGKYTAYTKDKLGNTANCSLDIDKIDKTKPTVTFETNGNNTYAKSQSTKVTVTDTQSGISTLKYQWTNSTNQPAVSTFTNTFASGDTLTKSDGTGDYYLWILAIDNAGNQIITKSNAFKLDNTNPTCIMDVTPTSWTSSATLKITATDGHSGISTYSFDGENYTTTNTKTINNNDTYIAYIKDKAGNIGKCSKEVTNIDTTEPIATIKTKAKTSKSITVTGTCTDNESGIKRYEFYLDGTKKATYEIKDNTKDYTYENVESKNHTYKLVCTNNASLTKEISGTETPNELEIPTYTVASGYAKSKTTTITYKGEGAYLLKTTGSATSNIELIDCGTVSNNGEYTCSTTILPVGSTLKENTWYKAANNPTLTYTSNGTLIAKTADGINYKQGSSLTISGVDNTSPTKPNITLKLNNASGSAYTSGTWTNNSVYVELSSTDTGSGIDHYEWYESGWTTRAMTTTGGVTSITYTAERNETVRFRAIDKAGNISEETSAVIKIDKTKPTCTNSGDSTTWTSGNRTITWGCSDTLSGCKTGYTGGSQTYTTSTKTVTIASYTIKDNAGNETTCQQRTANVYVDKTAPTLSLTKETYQEGFDNWSLPTGGSVGNGILTLSQSGSATSNYYAVNGEYWHVLYDAYTTTKANDDGTGGILSNSSYFDVNKNGIKSQNGYSANGNAPSFTLNEWKNNLSWDGWSGYGSDVKYLKFSFSTGNTYSQPPVKIRNFKVWGQLYNNSFYNINISKSDNVEIKTVKYATGNQTESYFTTGGITLTSDTLKVTENNTYTVYAEDTVGNKKVATINVNKIDTTKPTVAFGTNGNSTYAKSQSTKVTVTDNLSGISILKYQWTTSTTQPVASTFTTSFTNGSTITKSDGTGSYYLWILATDNAGNQTITRSNVFNLDNIAPTCSISGNPTSWTTSATLKATGSDSHSGVSSVVFTGTTSASKTVTSNGSVSATVTDKAGNTNTCSANVTKIDTEKPTCTITGLPTSWTTSAILTVSGTDSQSGVASYSWDGTTYGSTQTKTITANGTYTAYVKDKVGRIKNCSATVSKVDSVAPTAPVIAGGSGEWQNYNQIVWNTTNSTATSGIKKYQYCTNTSNTTSGCTWNDLDNNTDGVSVSGMDVAYYHQTYSDLINAFNGNVTKLVSHYNNSGKNEGRTISSSSWLRNAQNISKEGETYVFFKAISNSGLTSSASNTIHLKIDKTAPTCTNSGDSTTWTKADRTITWGCNDALSGCMSGYTGASKTFNANTSTASIAAYTIKDNAGNTTGCSARTANVYVEKTLTIPSLSSSSSSYATITGAYSSGAAISGIKSTNCYFGTTNAPSTAATLSSNNCVATVTATKTATTYYMKKCITSNAGNTSCSSVSSINNVGYCSAGNYNTTSTYAQTGNWTACNNVCGGGTQYKNAIRTDKYTSKYNNLDCGSATATVNNHYSQGCGGKTESSRSSCSATCPTACGNAASTKTGTQTVYYKSTVDGSSCGSSSVSCSKSCSATAACAKNLLSTGNWTENTNVNTPYIVKTASISLSGYTKITGKYTIGDSKGCQYENGVSCSVCLGTGTASSNNCNVKISGNSYTVPAWGTWKSGAYSISYTLTATAKKQTKLNLICQHTRNGCRGSIKVTTAIKATN